MMSFVFIRLSRIERGRTVAEHYVGKAQMRALEAKNAFLVSPSHKHPESCESKHETVEYSLRNPGVCIICMFVSSMHIALGS